MSVSFKELASLHDQLQIIQEEAPSNDIVSARQTVVMRTPGRSCKYCPDVSFDDLAEFREHHQEPWHIHNQNLCLRSRKPITEEEFRLSNVNADSESDDSDFWDEQEEEKFVDDDEEDERASPLATFVRFSDGKNTLSLYRSLFFATKSDSRSSTITTDQLRSFIQEASPSNWALFLFKGGKIYIGIYSVQQDKFVKKRLFKKYTERRKQGGSQLLRDKSGKVAKSAGSQMRRQNELDLLTNVKELMVEWAPDLKQCQLIFWNRTFFSQLAMFQTPSLLATTDLRLRKYPFNTYKPSEEEALRCAKKLSFAHKDA